MSRAWLEIGRVVSADAKKRSVRIAPAAGHDHEFAARERLWLQTAQEVPVPMRVARTSEAGKVFRVEFTPGVSRDVVAALRHARVLVPAEARTPRGPEAPALDGLVGMRVELPDGELLGEIFEVFETPAGGVFRMVLPDKRTAALPAIDAVIRHIDAASGVITVADPEPFLVLDDTAPDA